MAESVFVSNELSSGAELVGPMRKRLEFLDSRFLLSLQQQQADKNNSNLNRANVLVPVPLL